jgi:hypothetical protein
MNVTVGTSKKHVDEEAERNVKFFDGDNWMGMCK